jgi:hypothetical protein
MTKTEENRGDLTDFVPLPKIPPGKLPRRLLTKGAWDRYHIKVRIIIISFLIEQQTRRIPNGGVLSLFADGESIRIA